MEKAVATVICIASRAGDAAFVEVVVSSSKKQTDENEDKGDIVMECEDDVINDYVTLGESFLELLADVGARNGMSHTAQM